MSPLLFLFLPIFFSPLLSPSLAQPRSFLVDCGAAGASVIDGRGWVSDADYVVSGTPRLISVPAPHPTLATVRSFPLLRGRKFCFDFLVYRGAKYMVRTSYFYGGFNGGDSPPVFDQVVDGTVWGVVDTAEDYAAGVASRYEGVFLATGKTMSVCVGVNEDTDSDPFISAIELVILGDSLYNSTDFRKYGLGLISRNSFGYNGPLIRYPDDQFDRIWEPFGENNLITANTRNVSISGFWNLPPARVFEAELKNNRSESVELTWPLVSLKNTSYYIALYFADNGDSLLESSRLFNIHINDVVYYRNLNATPTGVAVFATKWPLVGTTKITLAADAGSGIVPSINAGEVLELLELGGRTATRDVIGLVGIRKSLKIPPPDWNGDPCLPSKYAWTGVTCSVGSQIRVTALNLTNMGLLGNLSPRVANMTAVTEILLGNNRLSGFIPDMGSLQQLEKLHLEGNQFSGQIPPSLGNIETLRELFLQNNNLTGQVPDSLVNKPGLNLRISPGNAFLSPPPP